MNRAKRRYQQKLAKKVAKSAKPIQSARPSSAQQTLAIQHAINLAIQHHTAGDFPKAESLYQQVLMTDPNQHVALHLLGVIAHQVGKNDVAVDLIIKALTIKPSYAEAHFNLGNVFKELKQWSDAAASYQAAIANKPSFAEAHSNLGLIFEELHKLDAALTSHQKAIAINPKHADFQYNWAVALQKVGKLDNAVESYQKAIAINPDYTEAYHNLGTVCQQLGNLEGAIANYQMALAIKTDYAEAHYNLGIALHELGRSDEAVVSYRRAITIKPDYAEAYNNLGSTLNNLGQLDEAVASYQKSISINPSIFWIWHNFKFSAKVRLFSKGRNKPAANIVVDEPNNSARATVGYAIHQFYLASFRPHEADDSFKKVIEALPVVTEQTIPINAVGLLESVNSRLPNQIVSLLHFGRSGTGLIHSLIDSHPEISTLPSIYLRGYFNEGVWDNLSLRGWRKLPERFADEFAVLFDARSQKPIPSRIGESSIGIGEKEGMTSVGDNRNEFLSMDRTKFCAVALSIMEGMEYIDPMSFLMVVHAAYDEVTGSTGEPKRLCFYHIHNPNEYTSANFLRYAPHARLLMMVREPIQSCESWIRGPFNKNDYEQVIFRIIAMLFDIDRIEFRIRESVGVRLEDLKTLPKPTIKSLCAWLGVKEASSLYEMTAQGKKWWGDPSSPYYSKDRAMKPFGSSMVEHSIGWILSKKDQFILGTLFYPFRVRFGYCEPTPEQFQKDLKEIRPLFDEMLDFERAMAERLNIETGQLERMGSYQLLRAGLIDRWEVLDEFGYYPHMLKPLSIDS